MEKWQENRNYRKIRDENGTVIANIITVDGRDVAVTEDVFAAYAQMDRRERYLSEDLPTGKVLSMEQLAALAAALFPQTGSPQGEKER